MHTNKYRPSKETLEELLKTSYMEQIARQFNVSSNAVRKWIRKFGITVEPQKHKGFSRNPESIEKGRNALIEYYKTHSGHNCKKIVQLTLNGEIVNLYDTIRSVESNGFNYHMVSKAIQKKLKTYKGFLWRVCSIENENSILSNCHRGDGMIRVYRCRYCGKLFTSRLAIRKHKKANHQFNNINVTYKCKICGTEIIGKQAFRCHMHNHYISDGYSCKFCGKTFMKRHQIAAHTARCKLNPNYKKTLEAQSRKLKGRFPNGMPQSTRDKISAKMKEYLNSHPEAASYKYNHSSKGSWAEDYFDTLFKNCGIVGYKRQFHVLRYKLDFAFISEKIDFEVDGHQHIVDKRIVKHDKERTDNLSELGWKTIRVDWGKFCSLSKEEKNKWLKVNLFPFINCPVVQQ